MTDADSASQPDGRVPGSGRPLSELSVPAAVQRLVDGFDGFDGFDGVDRRAARCVWENELGGLTFEIGTPADRFFVKWTPHASAIDLAAEAARLVWASHYLRVPHVLDDGSDETGSWLVTSPVPGSAAVSKRWRADPPTAVRAIANGLRAMHDTLPVDTCPFSWHVEHRLDDARQRAAAGRLNPGRWESPYRELGVDTALTIAADVPEIDQLVVCHGDACAPNTLLADDGEWSGHVDLGDLGVADRWADLAIATWSVEWNYGDGWDDLFFDVYGVERDNDRVAYYRLLWKLGP